MAGSVYEAQGIRIFECSLEGPRLRTARDATDLMGEAWSQGAKFIVIPTGPVDDDFFDLRTGIAGELSQKFATYGARVAILGDISSRLSKSRSLSAFVPEANRGSSFWFVSNQEELAARLSGGKF